MRNKIKLFDCIRCHKPVYRVGDKVRTDYKLCGKCNGKSRAFGKRTGRTKDQSTVLLPTETKVNDVCMVETPTDNLISSNLAKLAEYQNRLNKMHQLIQDNPNEPFISLWGMTK